MNKPSVADVTPVTGRTPIEVSVGYGERPPNWDSNVSDWPPKATDLTNYPLNIKTDMNYDDIPDAILPDLYETPITEHILNTTPPPVGIFVHYLIPTNDVMRNWAVPLVLPMKLPQYIPDCYIYILADENAFLGDVDHFQKLSELKKKIYTKFYTNRSIVFSRCL
jgi:hypothetical protein